MNHDESHIPNDASEERYAFLDAIPRGDEFAVPSGYFEDAELQILSKIEAESTDQESYFEEQAAHILSRIKLESIKPEEEKREEAYFDQQAEVILSKVKSLEKSQPAPKSNIRRMVILGLSAAACLVLGLLIWQKVNTNQSEFASLWEKDPLSEEELISLAEEDDLYEMYLSETEQMFADTLGADSLSMDKVEKTIVADSLIKPKAPQKLDPKTGLPIKPNTNSKATPVKFEDLTTDEMIEFLMEEGDEFDNDIN
jgi:hypothetical protein